MSTISRLVPAIDLRVVAFQLGALLRLLSIALVAPLVVALLAREMTQAAIFAALAALGLALGMSSKLLHASKDPSVRDAIVVTALAYPLFAGVGALAFLTETSFVDAFFESMSGFTTTGLSVLDPAALPRSLVFFRSYSQWIGGIGIVVLSLAVLGGTRSGALRFFDTDYGEKRLAGNVLATTRVMLRIYATLSGACFLALWAAGSGPWEALLHTLSTLSTGGFSPHVESAGAHAEQPSLLVVLTVFMLAGAVSFPLYHLAVTGRHRIVARDPQLLTLLGLAALGSVLFLLIDGTPLAAVFEAVSSLTTTGYTVIAPQEWPQERKLLGIGWMIVGGSSGSTAGGLKLVRLLLLVKLVHWSILRASLPREAKIPLKLGGEAVETSELRELLALLASYPLLLAVSTAILTAAGHPALDALFESASALGTVGLSTGITSAALDGGSKLLLVLNMWAGRLEVLPLLVLLYPRTWGFGRPR